MKDKQFLLLRLFNVITFAVMVVANMLANILPINGLNTGEISDSYPNLFAPAGITFAIWGLIYLLLGIFIVYQTGLIKGKSGFSADAVKRIGWYFVISSVANTIWIFCWHYLYIPLSLVLMAIVLVSLIMVYTKINGGELTAKEKFFIKLPFSVYFGWITVAAIANVTTLLVDKGFGGFGISETVWMILVLGVGTLIGGLTMLKNKDIAYGLVLVWAYAGILIKHTSGTGFAGEYPQVIAAVTVCILLFAAALLLILISKIRGHKKA